MSKVWLITGAGRGIGAEIAKAALHAGHRVVATRRNLEKLRGVYAGVASNRITFVQLDVTSEAQAKTAIEAALKQFGRVDVVVNNAGYSLLGNFEELAWEVCNHRQPGDPAKLGAALVKIADMESPPKQFLAASDSIVMVKPVLEARLKEIQDHADLSKSMDGSF